MLQSQLIEFQKIARFPSLGDNVAIAIRNLDAGSRIKHGNDTFAIEHTVLLGHRFATEKIDVGEALFSWGLPFGIATVNLAPGDYVCNADILSELKVRNLGIKLPEKPNFQDKITPYFLNENKFKPGNQVSRHDHVITFEGYRRSKTRGVGTRNYIVILGTTSRTASYARELADRMQGLSDSFNNIDKIVAVAHTEGGTPSRPNNINLLLRTLAGLIVHSNVGAVLAVDYGTEPLTNQMLQEYLRSENYPLDSVIHEFLTIKGSFQKSLDKGESVIRKWLPQVENTIRTHESVEHLKIALQCGGSDAFSGISGNPLVSRVAREIIRYGGSAQLAETNELIGAESYILKNVKDLSTAQRFLEMVKKYKEYSSWHGNSAEDNPSGGNKLRGLYNIYLKSIGAANKLHPDLRLDEVIDYSERMTASGYYFMNSPGNDLESIAGQVAAGCNMIFFVTGNGSITNFPFVPTIKVITTSDRYKLLSHEMDVNAGAFMDGKKMDELSAQMLDYTVEIASGRLSKGEIAGHSQVSFWRNWQQIDGSNLNQLLYHSPPDGKPIPVMKNEKTSPIKFNGIKYKDGYTIDRVGLILPTSLCAGQIANIAAIQLTKRQLGRGKGLSRFVSLVHTEGCGLGGESAISLYKRTLIGYLTHPFVKFGLLLEHGCEKTHNDFMRHSLHQRNLDSKNFGWASIQLDGGMKNVLKKVEDWFNSKISADNSPNYEHVGLDALSIGFLTSGPISENTAMSIAHLIQKLVGAGTTVVIPENTEIFKKKSIREKIVGNHFLKATLAYGQKVELPGFHLLECPTNHWVESLTGLGGTGVEIIIACIGEHPMQSHPMIPVIQVTDKKEVYAQFEEDIHLILNDNFRVNADALLNLIINVASREFTSTSFFQGNTDFQLTRGLLGSSV